MTAWAEAVHSEAAPARTFTELVGGLRIATSPSGRVVVIGRTPIENLQVSQWAEDVIARVGGMTGLPCPYERGRPLTLELHPGEGSIPPSEASVTMEDPGVRMVFNDLGRLPFDRARDALCGCVLSAVLLTRAPAGAAAASSPEMPGWIVCGISRSLFAPVRAEDGQAVLEAWEAGRLDTLAAFIERMAASGAAAPADRLDRARCGFVVAWLAAGGGRAEAFRRLLETPPSGAVTAAALTLLPGETYTPVSLEQVWDLRVLRESHVVSRPGRTSAESVRRFRAALLIYPGLCGMPMSSEPYRTVEWPALIEMRSEAWIPAFCVRKGNGLRVAASGRGDAMTRAADAYCAVLAGLRSGGSERRLRRLLDEALEASSELPGAQPASGSEGPGEGTP